MQNFLGLYLIFSPHFHETANRFNSNLSASYRKTFKFRANKIALLLSRINNRMISLNAPEMQVGIIFIKLQQYKKFKVAPFFLGDSGCGWMSGGRRVRKGAQWCKL